MFDRYDKWSIEDAINTYQIDRWSEGYFTVNNQGELCALPDRANKKNKISLATIIHEIKSQNIQFPCVIRFHDILRSQIKYINEKFNKTIEQANFNGEYFGVFPIKVNQLREVVEEVVDAGSIFNYGLEAGSKAELLTVLAYNNNPKSLTILNGHKDLDYIKLAALGTQIGRKMILVIEKFSEVKMILNFIEETGVELKLGVRAKLSTKGSGKWADSAGDKAKFGLTIPEILELIKYLKEKGKLYLLELFHFHSGSQIPDIRTIKESLTEAARIYADLIKLNVPIKYFDAGGGVGLNYDGSRSNCPSSTNYTLADYIADVVYILKDICDQANVKHPNIVTETGRAVSAHHSCVITNVFGKIEMAKAITNNIEYNESDHLILRNIKQLIKDLNHTNFQDVYNDACLLKEEAVNAFKLGIIDMQSRGQVENLYWNICHQIITMTENERYVPTEIKKLKFDISDKYLCNFSVFQSAPDAWAIDQILPIVPIQRLNEKPNIETTLSDITCDSDGKIDHFLGPEGHRSTIPLHGLDRNDAGEIEDYYIGLFLTGAYQDTMGDMHNLFGRLNEVHVFADTDSQLDQNNFYIEEIIHGQTAADVLDVMQYFPEEMCRIIKTKIDSQVKKGHLKPRTGVKLTDFYETSMHNYTYLN